MWHWSIHVPKITKIWGGHLGTTGWIGMEWPHSHSDHSISHTATLSASVMHGFVATRRPHSTGSWRGETQLHNHHCDGQRSARCDLPSTVAQFLSSLDSNRLRKRLAATCAECRRHVQWSVASSPWHSCQRRRAIILPDVCFLEAVTQWWPLIEQTSACSHSFDGFHTRI